MGCFLLATSLQKWKPLAIMSAGNAHLIFTCSKSTMEIPKQSVKSV